MEPKRWPSKVIEIQRASLGRLAVQDGFPDMERSSEKNSDLRSQLDCGSGRRGVKGQDERQRTAPLTPPRPPREAMPFLRLTGEDAVIHGAPGGVYTGRVSEES